MSRKWLLVAGWVIALETVASNQPREMLGRFTLGSFSGLVDLQEQKNDVQVAVIIGNVPPERPIPAETVQVWMLRAPGTASTLKHRFPSSGPLPGIGSGGFVDARAHFTFEKTERPVAVVLRIGDQFQVFAVPAKPRAR